ncbi:hypothetical protein PLESTM_000643800 [Pleodorina starrii]|nr:hypothetical protein PLESTM_000643800 [Pleodorina starrii]
MQPHLAYFPAVSLSYGERCELNYGAQPLLYPVSGYQPLQAAPPPNAVAASSYLVSCLERLVTSVQPREGGGGCGGPDVAAAAAAVGAAGGPRATSALRQPSHFVVPWESWLLMASIALDELAPYLLDEHIIAAVLMPAMLRLAAGASDGAASAGAAATTLGYLGAGAAGAGGSPSHGSSVALSGLLQLLELCLEPEMLSAVVNCLLETLSRRCVSAALVPEQFPYSASCPYLGLAAAIAGRPAARGAWLRHPNLWQMLEGFLTRKGPSPEDLRHLLPHVWWRGCSELSGDRERMRAGLQALSTAITRVEDKQYELLCCLLGSPGAGDPREDALVEFLRYLVHKNRGATRDVPPPGLSDSTVLISAYFVLVRMLRTALPLTHTFPAGSLFVKSSMKADLEPVNSLVRLGGIVTHLCRESPVTSQQELAPLAVEPPPRPPQSPAAGGGGASSHQQHQQLSPPPSSDADAWVVSCVRSCPRLAWELVDLAMALYAFKVGGSIRMSHNLSNSLAGSLAGMEEVERHLRRITTATSPGAGAGAGAGSSSSYAAYLRDARDVFRQEVSNNIRFSSLLKVVFFSGWKQEACLSLAAWLSRMLTAAASLPGPLLSYVPTCYLDCILDTLTSVRQAAQTATASGAPPPAPLPPAAAAPPLAALRTHGSLGDVIGLLVVLIHEPRICTPDAKEALVGGLAAALEQPGMLAEVEASGVARERLAGAAVAAFDSRLWHPVSQVLLRLVRGTGFGEAQAQGHQGVMVGTGGGGRCGGGGGGGGCGSALFRRLLVAELRPERPALQPFLHRLFNMVNWATSEFAATVADLHENRSRRNLTEQQQQFRKAGIMFDIVAGLLRLLEFCASRLPEAFTSGGPHAALNLNRLLEVVSFVLSHLTEGSDARRLTELLAVPPPDGAAATAGGPPAAAAAGPAMSSTVRIERTLLSEKVNKVHALAPVLGALLGLWRDCCQRDGGGGGGMEMEVDAKVVEEAESRGWSRTDSGGRAGSGGGSGGGGAASSGGSRAGVLLDSLLRHWDSHMDKQMSYLRAVDWRAALPAADPGPLEAGAREFAEMLAAAAARRQQLAASGEGGGGGGGGEEVPEELLDPITSSLMTDPVVLPDSQVGALSGSGRGSGPAAKRVVGL